MENVTEKKLDDKVLTVDENHVDKENLSGNKSDDSSSQHGSETSSKVGGIRLVSLSTLIDKPKAWVKEALMEPEIIELNSDDDSDDVIITECENQKKSEPVVDDSGNTNKIQTRRTDKLSERVKSKFHTFKESLHKHKEKDKKSVQTFNNSVDYSNFTSCRVVLEKVANLEKLKSKLKNKKNLSSSEDEEVPLAKLKTSSRSNKKTRKQSSSCENVSSTSDSETDNDRNQETNKSNVKTKVEIETKSKKLGSEEKLISDKKTEDSESKLQEKKIKKSGTKKTVGFDLSNETESKKQSSDSESDNDEKKKPKRGKKSVNFVDSEIEKTEYSIETDSESEFQQAKKHKGKKNKNLMDSESETVKTFDESESHKDIESTKSKSGEEKSQKNIETELNNEDISISKDEKSNGIVIESEIATSEKKTSRNALESESEEEETVEKQTKEIDETEEIIENSISKNHENDLKITIKRNKTVVPRKRVISSESEAENSTKDVQKMSASENEENGERDQESEKSAMAATNKKKRTRVVTSDESDKDFYPTKSKLPEMGNSSSEEKKSSDNEKVKKKIRRRIRTAKDSNESSSENENGTELNDGKGQRRKKIRKLLKHESLSKETKNAAKEEMERRKRIADRQKMYNEICKNHMLEKSKLDKVVLDFDPDAKKDLISVHPKLVSTLKPHQANGIKFMWDCCFESLEHAKESKGSGCILAHCMGLGKTLQVVTLIHTLITHEETGIKRVMVVCPLSTVLNWVNEFNIWLSKINDGDDVEVYELTKYKKMIDRSYRIKDWHENGGVLVIGYEMFRNLSCSTNKRIRKPVLNRLQTGLIKPGPDLVVCDEGHLLKNEKARISVAMNKIETLRRIVLTGTPLQNNLKEYYCMIQFVKPNLLGTYKEYTNRFVNPIVNGQYIDSTPRDIEIMKRRSHVLHKLLDGVVQRRDYSVLAPFLPPKQEYVLYLTLHPLQEKLYEMYIQNYSKRVQQLNGAKAVALFSDFQELSRIWTHPRSLRFYSDKCEKERQKRMSDSDDFIDDESEASTTPDSSSDDSDYTIKKKKSKRPRITRAKAKEMGSEVESSPEDDDKNSDSDCKIIEEEKLEFDSDWWVKHVDDAVLEDITYSSKLLLLFKILKKCEEIGDKVLVFSQSLFSLDLIEYFLNKLDYASHNKDDDTTGWLADYSSSWDIGLDYFRLDGSSSVDNRASWCKLFNDVTNTRARLFLISTKAGGLGINLVAANRVIIFDVSWNPSHDIQSIFRVYRFGQTKPCYIYRFIAMGTMEEKVYERQVTKLAISKRVIDEHQIDRHYNQNDLNELYKFTPMSEVEKPIPMVPKDRLLAETLQELNKQIFKYHEHDSLLEHKEDEELDEEERKAAWDEFENEKQQKPPPMTYYPQYNMANNINNQFQIEMQNTSRTLEAMLRQRNPSWTDLQIQHSIPILLQQVYQFAPEFQHQLFPHAQFGMLQPQPGFPQPNTSMMQQSEYNAAQ